jgi:hypothetical protein
MLPLTFSPSDLQIFIILVALGTAILFLLTGMIVLITRGFSKEMQVLASTSSELSKRAMSHSMTELTGNLSEILSTINQMLMTSAGVGAFLALIGIAMLAAAYWLTLQI